MDKWGVAGMTICLVSGWLMFWLVTWLLERATGAVGW